MVQTTEEGLNKGTIDRAKGGIAIDQGKIEVTMDEGTIDGSGNNRHSDNLIMFY